MTFIEQEERPKIRYAKELFSMGDSNGNFPCVINFYDFFDVSLSWVIALCILLDSCHCFFKNKFRSRFSCHSRIFHVSK